MNITRINANAIILHGSIIGCPDWKYAEVWVKCKGMQDAMLKFSSMTSVEDVWYGKLTTRCYREATPPLKVGPARFASVDKHYDKLKKAEERLLAKFALTCAGA